MQVTDDHPFDCGGVESSLHAGLGHALGYLRRHQIRIVGDDFRRVGVEIAPETEIKYKVTVGGGMLEIKGEGWASMIGATLPLHDEIDWELDDSGLHGGYVHVGLVRRGCGEGRSGLWCLQIFCHECLREREGTISPAESVFYSTHVT